MNEQEKIQKLNAILADNAVIEELSNAESKEAMRNIFKENGLEMTIEEVDAFICMMNTSSGEIDEVSLDAVTGGSVTALWIFQTSWKITKKVAKYAWNAGKWFANNVG